MKLDRECCADSTLNLRFICPNIEVLFIIISQIMGKFLSMTFDYYDIEVSMDTSLDILGDKVSNKRMDYA
jgi:hypothetical protein